MRLVLKSHYACIQRGVHIQQKINVVSTEVYFGVCRPPGIIHQSLFHLPFTIMIQFQPFQPFNCTLKNLEIFFLLDLRGGKKWASDLEPEIKKRRIEIEAYSRLEDNCEVTHIACAFTQPSGSCVSD